MIDKMMKDSTIRDFRENELVERTVYDVFPGIQLIYNAIHTDVCSLFDAEDKNLIVINHCQEGRCEQQIENELFYLMPGDFSISMREKEVGYYHFPLKHYHGITILIDTDVAPKCFSCFLKDVEVQPMAVVNRLCQDKSCFVIRSEDYIKHIFSELYSTPPAIKQGYFKVKILELLLFLSAVDIGSNESGKRAVSMTQANLAKSVSKYLTDHMDEKVPLWKLAGMFHVSEANIKTAFKAVYGVPVYAYVRTQKMESASYMLEYTDKPILEIAGEHGYDNGSKFASAFRDVKGLSPTEYRALHHQ